MCTMIERLLGFVLTELQAVTENVKSGKYCMSIIALCWNGDSGDTGSTHFLFSVK